MSHSLLSSITWIVSYTIVLPLVLFTSVVASTYVYTNLRYRIACWQNRHTNKRITVPVKLPYAIPYVGNALQFLDRRPGTFYTQLFRIHPKNTGTCTLNLGGRNTHVLYDPNAIQALLKAREPHRDSFNIDVVVKAFGVSASEAQKYFGHGEGVSEKFQGRTPAAEQERILHDYLLKTERVNELTSRFTNLLQKELSDDFQDNQETKEVGLYSWLRGQMFRASTASFFGTTIIQDYPDLEEDFFEFDTTFLTCYFGVPRFVKPEPYEIRDRVHKGMLRWHQRNFERNKGHIVDAEGDVEWEPLQGSRENRARQQYYDARDINMQSRAILDLGLLSGISSNAIPAAGWMLMHILDPRADKSLLPRVMEEITRSQKADSSFDISTLANQPLLLSLLNETLRLYVDTLVTRELPHDLVLPIGEQRDNRKILLEQGSIVMTPTWLEHRDTDLWHDPPAHIFHPERFLTADPDVETKTAGRPKFSTAGTGGKFFPFGGGKTICPGRVFAKQEILASVAMVLATFEFEVLGFLDARGNDQPEFPRLKDAYPGSAVMITNEDVKVRIKRRS